MKLVSFIHMGQEKAGILFDETESIWPFPIRKDGGDPMSCMIADGLHDHMAQIKKEAESSAVRIPLHSVKLVTPIRHPSAFLCIGLNYQTHAIAIAKERGEVYKKNDFPAYFSKRILNCTYDGDPIEYKEGFLPELEGGAELAVIIGKDARNVPREKAWEYILGFSIHNDLVECVTNRLYVQPMMAKSYAGYAPVGPWIVTADEFPPDHIWRIRLTIGGELRADDTTDHMSFDVAYMVSQLSTNMTLKAGTIIASGSPGETLPGISEHHYPLPGEAFVCEISGIGTLTTPVIAGEIPPPYANKKM